MLNDELKESYRGLIHALARHFPRGSEQIKKNLSRHSRWQDWDSNLLHLKQKCSTLPLHQRALALNSYSAIKYENNLIYILIIVQRDATKSSLFIILQIHSTCFGCQPHPSSGVHKTVTTASGSCTKNMTSTGGCSYSFVYSWCWVWLTPETCRVNLQNNK